MKKSQIEIFGVIIVVVLIFLGMFFMMTIGSTKKSGIKDSYVTHQVSANVLNSILAMKVVCTEEYSLTMTELLQNCAGNNNLYCDQTSIFRETNVMMDSCEFSRELIQYSLNNTLNKWQINYFLNITKNEESVVNSDGVKISFVYPEKRIFRGVEVIPGCQRKLGGTSKLFPVPLNPGTLWIELFVCN